MATAEIEGTKAEDTVEAVEAAEAAEAKPAPEKKPPAKKAKKAKAKKAAGAKPKKAKASEEKPKKVKKSPELRMLRGWSFNKWEKWLGQRFEKLVDEDISEIHNSKLVEEIAPYVAEMGGPEDARRVVLNSVRRLVNGGWVVRSSRGAYKATEKLVRLGGEKTAIGEKLKKAREESPWTREQMANLLGHPTRGRYTTLEQGRRSMHVWEAHTLSRALGTDIP